MCDPSGRGAEPQGINRVGWRGIANLNSDAPLGARITPTLDAQSNDFLIIDTNTASRLTCI